MTKNSNATTTSPMRMSKGTSARQVQAKLARVEEAAARKDVMSADKTDVSDMITAKNAEAVLEKVAKPWYMMDPRSDAMARWDVVTSLALIYTVVMSPVEVAFLPAPDNAAEPLFLINRFIDIVFICDIFICFATIYKTETGHSSFLLNASLVWEVRPRWVARRYVRGWFVIDVASVLPSAFDFTTLDSSSDACGGGHDGRSPIKIVRCCRVRTPAHVPAPLSNAPPCAADSVAALLPWGPLHPLQVRMIRILRLFKLMRLLRASRLMARFERRNTLPYSYISFVQIISQASSHTAAVPIFPTTSRQRAAPARRTLALRSRPQRCARPS
jgi:hypothetical protein